MPAKHGTSRTRQSLKPTDRRERNYWSKEEDDILRAAVLLYGDETPRWCNIAESLKGRTSKDCRKRWFNGLNQSLKKGAWTAAEDDLLRRAVNDYGHDWARVSQIVHRRSGDQCSKRWREVLDPTINKDPWTPTEDELLIKLVKEHGCHWQIIHKFFDNRRSLQCRNRWCCLTGSRNKSPKELPFKIDSSTPASSSSSSDSPQSLASSSGHDEEMSNAESSPADYLPNSRSPEPSSHPMQSDEFNAMMDLSGMFIPRGTSPFSTADGFNVSTTSDTPLFNSGQTTPSTLSEHLWPDFENDLSATLFGCSGASDPPFPDFSMPPALPMTSADSQNQETLFPQSSSSAMNFSSPSAISSMDVTSVQDSPSPFFDFIFSPLNIPVATSQVIDTTPISIPGPMRAGIPASKDVADDAELLRTVLVQAHDPSYVLACLKPSFPNLANNAVEISSSDDSMQTYISASAAIPSVALDFLQVLNLLPGAMGGGPPADASSSPSSHHSSPSMAPIHNGITHGRTFASDETIQSLAKALITALTSSVTEQNIQRNISKERCTCLQ